MSQRSAGRGQGAGKQRRREDWTEVARTAAARVAAADGSIKIKCPGNLLLYVFLA
jgi:hypothetical protein